jgi:aminoglycoside phosphotransferase (APT) family kinase protein
MHHLRLHHGYRAGSGARLSAVDDDAALSTVRRWLETIFGGEVVALTRQPRWRPVWFATVERDGATHELCVRGDRVDMDLKFPLAHEMRLQRLLLEHGVPVPAVHGWIDEPAAYVMDQVPGQYHFGGTHDADRRRVVDEYLQALAVMHALPVGPFADAGIARAAIPEASGTVGLDRYIANYRAQQRHPDPFLEFALGWIARNPPRSRGREAPVVWDSGQFHHHDGHLAAILDLELGHLGDPMMDLAGWRMRDSIMGYGDFGELYDRYSELTGEPVDLDAIELHHIVFTLSNQLAFSHALRDPAPGSDLTTNLQWCNETNLYFTEALADRLDIELPTVEMPDPARTRVSAAHAHLVDTLRSIGTDAADTGNEVLAYRVRGAFRLARHLMRVDEIGDQLIDADLDDLHRLLGRRPADWFDGEAELDGFVRADAGEGRHDEALLVLFHRRNLRAQMLNGPAGSAMVAHIPIQRFGRS